MNVIYHVLKIQKLMKMIFQFVFVKIIFISMKKVIMIVLIPIKYVKQLMMNLTIPIQKQKNVLKQKKIAYKNII